MYLSSCIIIKAFKFFFFFRQILISITLCCPVSALYYAWQEKNNTQVSVYHIQLSFSLNSPSHEGMDTPAGSEDVQIIMSSFRSHVVKVRVAKQLGKQHLQLLSDDDDESGGLWTSITR